MSKILSMLGQGGWPMIPILLGSLIALAIIIERAFALRRTRVLNEEVLKAISAYDGEASAQKTLHICHEARGPFARLIEEVLNARHLEHAQALESMRATGRTQVSTLERGLTVLEIVAAISPLMGLLGTVLGMITVFDAITSHGIGNPQVLSEGISKALITTVAGMTAAIPALAFHSWFTRRVDQLSTEMQERATAFILRVQVRGDKQPMLF